MRVMRDGIRLWGLGGLMKAECAEQASRAGHTLKKNHSFFFHSNFFFKRKRVFRVVSAYGAPEYTLYT